MRTRLAVAAGVIALVLSACGGGRTAPTVATTATDGTGNGGSGGDPTAIAEGKTLFDGTCSACHAQGGVGVEGLGKPLITSEFVAGLSDPDLMTFIKTGRDTADPLNTTGIAMPPYGGNPSLSDEQIGYIVAYVREINQGS